MPPRRHTAGAVSSIVWPDRCPAGHRGADPKVRWRHSTDAAGRHTWICYACKPRFGLRFHPRPELYDDLSWWYDADQAKRRV
jgi:hypothetical protein